MVMIGAALMTAVAMGAVGGAITAAFTADFAWGALAVVGVYLATAPLFGYRMVSFVGVSPLILTFLVAALTTRQPRRIRELPGSRRAPYFA
jgi:hypothetical protein